MKIAVLYLTDGGEKIAERLKKGLSADIFGKYDFTEGLGVFVKHLFFKYDGIIFVMAAGIAVRTIAPLIKDKKNDPAIVVMDEKGRFAISLLSGHIGGANLLSEKAAEITGGLAVITTATDINSVIAFDVFAYENDCFIENINVLKYISSDIVNGKSIGLFLDYEHCGIIPEYIKLKNKEQNNVIISNKLNTIKFESEHCLIIRPKNLVIGIGCKKNTSKKDIEYAVNEFLVKNNKSIKSIKCMASIDLKKHEKGILEYCTENNIEFKTLSSEKLSNVENEFTVSRFVKEHTGAGSVSEACAVYGIHKAELICHKTVYNSITLALGELKANFEFG